MNTKILCSCLFFVVLFSDTTRSEDLKEVPKELANKTGIYNQTKNYTGSSPGPSPNPGPSPSLASSSPSPYDDYSEDAAAAAEAAFLAESPKTGDQPNKGVHSIAMPPTKSSGMSLGLGLLSSLMLVVVSSFALF